MPRSEQPVTQAQVHQAMIMAAGLGTRLRPFTGVEPKAFLPLMGVPMAQFAVDAASGAGAERVVLNFHHLAGKATSAAGGLDLGGMRLTLSDESDELLGSAGGIRKALPHFGDDPFFLLNADVLCGIDLGALARRHARLRASHGVSMTLAVFRSGPRGGKYREILLDPSASLVRGLGELQSGRPFFVGAAVLETEALRNVPLSGPAEFVPTVLEPAIRERKAAYFLADGLWYDVGSPELWFRAHLELMELLETGRLPSAWRARVETVNRRIAPGLWVSKNAARPVRSADWAGPAYWNPWREASAEAPRELGPRAVLYGSTSGARRDGIGFGGAWVSVGD